MKRYINLSIVCLSVVIFACQSQTSPSAEKETIRNEITSFLNEFYSTYKSGDFEALADKLSEKSLFMGTDSKEVWNKSEMLAMLQKKHENSNDNFTYKITTRIIRISEDQNSVLVIEQLEDTPVFGENLPVRVTTQLQRQQNEWQVNFISWSIIPDNKDLFKFIDFLSKTPKEPDTK
ncbi:nuclear transport factor 2 family protein [Maribellus sp. YY47]|uniref:nuclear transport factor 2 family protein n=1 Tax=Maribellus sp. YY47 TaxID=2929486 RepID=UPI002000D263|nr:nuclear transport factor 2 family protein [Maribellus sp. YY47]MCK3685421.1 nuclear transport factor 2 family protein [Maribellus sp. YY47]